MPRLGPVVAPVQGELPHDRGRSAVAVGLTGRFLAVGRARFVALVRIADLVAAARASAVVARTGIFGHPADVIAALVRAVLGAAACVLVLRRGADTVAAGHGTVVQTGLGGLGRTTDFVSARRGTIDAAVARVLGLTTVAVAALLGAVDHALLAAFTLNRVTRAITALGGTDVTIRRTRIARLSRLAARAVPALGCGRRTAVVRDIVAVVVDAVPADLCLRTRRVTRAPPPGRTLFATRCARDHA